MTGDFYIIYENRRGAALGVKKSRTIAIYEVCNMGFQRY
jgi:hypothetical protein